MIHAVILAAGLSRRMGAQKLLLPYAGRTLIGHVAGQVAASGADRIVAVVRGGDTPAGRAGDVAEALAGLGVERLEIVVNADADGDMLSSVRCGLRALPGDCEGFLVALGDQPTITAALIDRMIAVFRAAAVGRDSANRSGESNPAAASAAKLPAPAAGRAAGHSIVVPAHQHRRGHPILFAACCRREVLTGLDGVGLRGLLAAHPEDVLELPEADPAILADLDWPEDYRRALAELQDHR
jgi:molybdenum cofactor cytidylyltransferase